MTRRSALKLGSAAALAGAGMALLSGCAPKVVGKVGAESGSSSNAGTGTGPRSLYAWLGEEPAVEESKIEKTVDVDVVILGSGHAGTQCAKSAAEAGVSVAVVEQQAESVHNYYGEDIGTFNSDYVTNMGYGPYDMADVLEQWLMAAGWRVSVPLAKNYIENSGAMIDEFIGLVQERKPELLANMNVQLPSSAFWWNKSQPCDMGTFKTYVGTFCMRSEILSEPVTGVGAYSTIGDCEKVCIDYAKEKGAQWFFDTEAVKAIVEDGKVTGAYGKTDGGYIRFNAKKAVVIALGSFRNDEAMCDEFFNEARELLAKDGTFKLCSVKDATRDTGLGHRIGCWAGGRMEAGPSASLSNVSAPGPFGFSPTLYLNSQGKRFMNEADFNAIGSQVFRQPKGLYCCIYGRNYEQIIQRGGTNHGGTDFGQATYVAQWREDMTKVLDAGADGYLVRHGCLTERADNAQVRVYGAQDLATLAGYLGYTGEAVDNIVASVARYNELVAGGADVDFGKKACFMLPIEAPFYGCSASTVGQAALGGVTLGGLVTDGNYNVLDDEDVPIQGLYAIGNCCGQRYALTYPGILAGNSLGQAMTNGYVCGKIVAAL